MKTIKWSLLIFGVLWAINISFALERSLSVQSDSTAEVSQRRKLKGLDRYREANTALPVAEEGEQRVIFFGDSITDNWDLDESFQGEAFINRGIGGEVTEEMMFRVHQDVFALEPSVVFFLGGTNDMVRNYSNGDIFRNVRSFAKQCHERNIQLIICSILPISDYHKNRESRLERSRKRPPERILVINEGLENIAQEEEADYLDLHEALADGNGQMPAQLSSDGLHPNRKCYSIMAPLVFEAVGMAKQKARSER